MTIVFEGPMSEEFEQFFTDRPGWSCFDLDFYEYMETFVERDQLDRNALEAVDLYPLSVRPDGSDPSVALCHLAGFEAGEHEYRYVDLKASDAEQQVAHLEAQAREASAVELFRQLVLTAPA